MIQRKETLEDILSLVEAFYEQGKGERAARELERGRSEYPESFELLEWEAVFALDQGCPRDALGFLNDVLARQPERRFARKEKANALQELGRFEDALDVLLELGPEGDRDPDYYFHLACCLDRSGRAEEADQNFARACELDPDEFRIPMRLGDDEFDGLVGQVLETLPDPFRRVVARATVVVEDYPGFADPDPFIFGLFSATPRIAARRRARETRRADRLIFFKRNLEVEFPDADDIQEEVRKTTVHELAHFLGLGDELELLEF